MSIQELEAAVAKLPPEQLRALYALIDTQILFQDGVLLYDVAEFAAQPVEFGVLVGALWLLASRSPLRIHRSVYRGLLRFVPGCV